MEIIPIVLSVIFIATGFSKLAGLKIQKQHFKHWNLPLWFMYLTGALEIIVGGCLLFEATQYFGILLGSIVLLGAIATCWIASEYKRSIPALLILIILGFLIWQGNANATFTWVVFIFMGLSLLLSAFLWVYKSTPLNKDGETELLDQGTLVTHHFRQVLGVNYHYVTSGNPDNQTVVIVPGAPESWFCFQHQIIALSKKYFVLAMDMKPYGQTEKDLDGNHSFAHIADEIKALLDELQIDQFHLMAHDRGSIASDHLLSKNGMSNRVTSYIRMQQSFNEPHGEPLPPHQLMSNFFGTMGYKYRYAMNYVYGKSDYIHRPPSKKVIQRISKEFKFKGIPQGVPLSFKTTSFAKELKERREKLFQYMTMPVLLLQGRYDPGQHPEEYLNSHQFAPNLKVKFVEAGHFFHLEAPEEANEYIMAFYEKQKQGVGLKAAR